MEWMSGVSSRAMRPFGWMRERRVSCACVAALLTIVVEAAPAQLPHENLEQLGAKIKVRHRGEKGAGAGVGDVGDALHPGLGPDTETSDAVELLDVVLVTRDERLLELS